MLELHVLGTSGSRPTRGRSVSGNFLSTPSGAIVIDCGEGFQERLLKHDLALKATGTNKRARASRIRAVLLTHSHLDHCWGLLPFLYTMDLDGRTAPLTIIAPTAAQGSETHPDFSGLFESWRDLLSGELSRGSLGFPVEWVLIPVEGDEPIDSPVQPLEDVHLTAVPTRHGVVSVGWMVTIPERPGRFNRERAASLGLTDRQVSRLAGGESVSHDGAQLDPTGFRAEARPPCRLLVSGDTTRGVPSFNQESLGGPVDLLIHEATYTSEHHDKSVEYGHSTAADAATAASAMGAGVLGMVHMSTRIRDPDTLESEAKAIHPSSFVCEDEDIIEISSDGDIGVSRRRENAWMPLSIE